MLNKEICKRCIVVNGIWGIIDENRWKNGKVYCRKSRFISNKIENEPSEDCPYYLEQVIQNA